MMDNEETSLLRKFIAGRDVQKQRRQQDMNETAVTRKFLEQKHSQEKR